MHANDYDSREELVRVVVKARHRRWETAEINAALVDLDADPFDLEIDELCGCHECAWGAVAEEPPSILPVTLFDADIARRLRR